MHTLSAKFDIHLPSALLLQRDETEKISYKVRIEDFDVEISFAAFEYGHKQKLKNEQFYSFGITRVFITVTGNEDVAPPLLPANQGQKNDNSHEAFHIYCRERASKYQKIAVIAVNRLIKYFKFELQNPLLYELSIHDEHFSNPKWITQSGQGVGSDIYIRVTGLPGLKPNSYSAKTLTQQDDQKLIEALQKDKDYELYEEILSDAQSAIFQSNLRRTILEMAIACEIAIKQTLFSKSTIAGSAFEYLEDKGRINIRLIELIDGVASEAFGESFKKYNGAAYTNIDHLFRCRNKVAHRGQPLFSDDSGNKIIVDGIIIKEWWESVQLLFTWLKKYRT